MAAGSSGWLELLSTDTLTAVIAVIGIVLRMFCSAPTKKHVGEISFGFAVLMFGMKAMSSSVYDLRSSETFINMLTTFSNPILGIALGIVFTSVIQSASAAVGILQALAITVPYALYRAAHHHGHCDRCRRSCFALGSRRECRRKTYRAFLPNGSTRSALS